MFDFIFFCGCVIIPLIIIERYSRKKYTPVECTEHDRIAIDQTIFLLHAYAQVDKGESIDFTKQVIEREIIKHQAIPTQLTKNWNFYPFQGTTGTQKWVKSLLSRRVLLGMVGCNEKKKLISIVFRNTKNLSDCITGLKLNFSRNHQLAYKGPVHVGCSSILASSIDELNELLLQLRQQHEDLHTYTFIIGGHSLGGALATLLAAYIIEHPVYKEYVDYNKIKLITFGAPYAVTKSEKHHFGHWIAQYIPYIKCFERSTDMAPVILRFIKMQSQRIGRWWHKKKSVKIDLIPVAKPIPLFHFNNSRFNFIGGHNIEKYREAIYLQLGLSYKALLYIYKII